VSDLDCGGSLPGSYAYFDPDTWLLRMSQGSLFPSDPDDPLPSDAYLESLPGSGLMLNGRLYPQDPWEVPSCGDVCSSSPTLRATEVDQGNYQRDNGQVGKERLTLKGLVKSLEGTPTLTATAADRGGRGELLHYVKTGTPRGPITPTLTARDYKDGRCSEETWAKGGRPLNEYVQRLETTPTLTASNATCGPESLKSRSQRETAGGAKLIDIAAHLSGRGGGVLNPRWSEWYMGFPVGWCEIPSEPSETP